MKNTTIYLFSLLGLLSSCDGIKKKDKGFKTLVTEKTAKLDTLYRSLYEEAAYNGNILVAEAGEIIYQESFGLANEETKEMLNLESVFDLASVSKQFTAMGIVQLQKEGKLNYDDPISMYIPELSFYESVTIKHLLLHTSGLPDYMEIAKAAWDTTKIISNTELIKIFQNLEPDLRFEPMQKWEYSNTGYMLLGTIIERLSGQSFEAYLKETIFSPLKMNNSFVHRKHYTPKQIENYAQGYIYSDSLKKLVLPSSLGKNNYNVYLDGVFGDGAIHSNLHDLLKWDRALYGDKLVSQEDKALIFASYPTQEGETNYGFGWFVKREDIYGKIIQHSGGWAGYRTYIERHLDTDKTILSLQNHNTPRIELPIADTRKLLYDLPIAKRLKLPDALLEKYAGTYLMFGEEIQILLENGRLRVPMRPGVYLDMIPKTETVFIVKGFQPEVSYEFILNEESEVLRFVAKQPEQGVEFIGDRVVDEHSL